MVDSNTPKTGHALVDTTISKTDTAEVAATIQMFRTQVKWSTKIWETAGLIEDPKDFKRQ